MNKKIHYFIWLWIISYAFIAVPAFAAIADEDRGLEDNMTFHVYDDVDLVSTLKFEYGKPRIVIKSVYPQLVSETEREGVGSFNELALQLVKDEVKRFRSLIRDYAPVQNKMDKKAITNNLYIDYNTSYLKPKHDHIMSIRFSMQGVVGGIKHPYHNYTALNYNLDKDQQILLSDLFHPGADYLDIISQYTYGVLQKRLGNNGRMSGAAPRLENYMTWNIKPNGLFITFNEGQVAPKRYGTQTVLVPYSVLKEIIATDSPIAECIRNPSKCMRHNLVTGGFIDEAKVEAKDKLQTLASSRSYIASGSRYVVAGLFHEATSLRGCSTELRRCGAVPRSYVVAGLFHGATSLRGALSATKQSRFYLTW